MCQKQGRAGLGGRLLEFSAQAGGLGSQADGFPLQPGVTRLPCRLVCRTCSLLLRVPPAEDRLL